MKIKPSEVYHLAAQSYVGYSFEDEFSTLNININGTDVIGTITKPAIIVIDGNLDKLNGAEIFGIVYVTGTLEIAGNPIVKGSIVAENPLASTGAGTLTLVFKPWGGNNGAPMPFIIGTGAITAGSWNDWLSN